MKKYLIISSLVLFSLLALYFGFFYASITIFPHNTYKTNIEINGKEIKVNGENFTIEAINLGSKMPAALSGEYNIGYDKYLEWFDLIKKMNINTIRVFNIEPPEFYEALKYYNENNDPLYLIQGTDAGTHEKNSKYDYYNKKVKNNLLDNVKKMVDVVHGRKIILFNNEYASGNYKSDVSKWTIGYIIGSEWNDGSIEYTNHLNLNVKKYVGKYLKAKETAKPFENFLTEIGDKLISYETKKYGEQRFISFGSTPLTDPFDYDEGVIDYFNKITKFDIDNIEETENYKSGLIASFQAYSNYPDFYSYYKDVPDSYLKYLDELNEHYDMPVIISEVGYSTARATSTKNTSNQDNNGVITEEAQGKEIISAIEKIRKSGVNNFIIYEWQDEWDKTMWNTIYATDTTASAYWHNVETSSQGYGIYKFVPTIDDITMKIDGQTEDWKDEDIKIDNDDYKLSYKYDSEYIYFLIDKKKSDFNTKTYIPIDLTTKSGTQQSKEGNLTFDRNADFLIKIDGKDNSEILVQDYYNSLRAMYGKKVYMHDQYEKENMAKKDSNNFESINLITSFQELRKPAVGYEVVNEITLLNTGHLVYGNNSNSADFYYKNNLLEIRIPWHLLNFSNPSKMEIHDDYYEHYGVESYKIKNMYIGVGEQNQQINLEELELKGWGRKVKYKEELKPSYEVIKNYLKGEN